MSETSWSKTMPIHIHIYQEKILDLKCVYSVCNILDLIPKMCFGVHRGKIHLHLFKVDTFFPLDHEASAEGSHMIPGKDPTVL